MRLVVTHIIRPLARRYQNDWQVYVKSSFPNTFLAYSVCNNLTGARIQENTSSGM